MEHIQASNFILSGNFLITGLPCMIFTCSASAGQCLITVVVVLLLVLVVGKKFKIEA